MPSTKEHCKFGIFSETFISRIFDFQIISEFLNSRASSRVVYKTYSNPLLARTLSSEATNSRILVKIKLLQPFLNLQYKKTHR